MTGRNLQEPAQQRSAPSQLSKGEVINELASCLTLVRPVGMSDDAATEWLAIAANELMMMRPAAFREACGQARRECSHHGQIVPTILGSRVVQEYQTMGASAFLPAPKEDRLEIADGATRNLIEGAAKALTKR